jgi:hypothetical protein
MNGRQIRVNETTELKKTSKASSPLYDGAYVWSRGNVNDNTKRRYRLYNYFHQIYRFHLLLGIGFSLVVFVVVKKEQERDKWKA